MYDIEKHRCEVVTSAALMDGFYIRSSSTSNALDSEENSCMFEILICHLFIIHFYIYLFIYIYLYFVYFFKSNISFWGSLEKFQEA